jgi:folate-binding protein YgfZ
MFSPEQYRALRQASGFLDRSSRGRLRLRGQDRRSYLQGLLTNDIDALSAGTGCYACLLTPQGRMIADMYVSETGDEVLLDLPGDVAEKVRAQLEQFIFSEDVQVDDVGSALAQTGVYGPTADAVLTRVLSLPADPSSTLASTRLFENRRFTFDGQPIVIVRRDDIGLAGFEIFLDANRSHDFGQSLLNAGAVRVEPESAEVTRVEGGRPEFHKDMNEDTIPLEAGIEDRAISLTKGCYVGQEIIIRVLHRGHGRVARRLVGLTLGPTATVPPDGMRIRAGVRDIGHVTSAVWSPALGRPIAMGYVHRDFVEPSTVVDVVSGDGQFPAVVVSLPFVVEGAEGAERAEK